MEKINLNDFDNIIACIRSNVGYFERTLEANKYSLNLANGDYINIVIPSNCIGHLLGIKIDELKSSGIIRMDTSISEVIRKLINSEITYQGLKNKGFPIEKMFSEFIEKKLEIFTEVIKIRTDDLEFIVKYSTDRTYTSSDYAIKGDYFIIRKHEDEIYSALGLVYNENMRKYIPNTSRLFINKEELQRFLSTLKNQEVTYPTCFTIDNYDQDFHKTFYSKLDEKLIWCKKLKFLASNFGLIPVNNSDVLFIIEKYMNANRDNSNNISVITAILENIKSGTIIEKKYLMESLGIRYMSEEVSELIDTINNYLYSNTKVEIAPEYSFTELTNRINELEKENNSDKKELERVQAQLRIAQEEIARLNQQLEISNQCLNIYEEANAKVLELKRQNNDLTI